MAGPGCVQTTGRGRSSQATRLSSVNVNLRPAAYGGCKSSTINIV